jgi:hypothetical protein
MRITTQFISPFLEHKWVHKHFSKYLFFSNNKEKQKLFFLSTTRSAHRIEQAHSRSRPDQPSGDKARRPGSRLRPTAALAQWRARGNGHATPAFPASRQRSSCQRPTAIAGHDQHDGARTGSARRWRTRECGSRGDTKSEGAGGRSTSSAAPAMVVRAEMLDWALP